jgi:hypothetical protein
MLMINIHIDQFIHLVITVSHHSGRLFEGLLITNSRYFSIPLPLGSAKGEPMMSSSAEISFRI